MSKPGSHQHFLYLSLTAWGELKRRATLEATTASRLLDRLLQAYSDLPIPAEIPRRGRGEQLDFYERRSLHLQDATWTRIQDRAKQETRSVSAIAEECLRGYLGLNEG